MVSWWADLLSDVRLLREALQGIRVELRTIREKGVLVEVKR